MTSSIVDVDLRVIFGCGAQKFTHRGDFAPIDFMAGRGGRGGKPVSGNETRTTNAPPQQWSSCVKVRGIRRTDSIARHTIEKGTVRASRQTMRLHSQRDGSVLRRRAKIQAAATTASGGEVVRTAKRSLALSRRTERLPRLAVASLRLVASSSRMSPEDDVGDLGRRPE